MDFNRRTIMQAVAASGATRLFGASAAQAQAQKTRLTYATLNSGVSVIFNEYLKVKRPDLSNDLDIVITNNYTSVASYYNDFIAGTFDLAIGAWDSFYAMYQRGVPVSLICTVNTGSLVNIVVRKGGPANIAALKDKSIAAVASAGSYAMSRALIKEMYGLELGKDVTVQNVPSPVQALTLLLSGNAEAALSWEPSVSMVMAKQPDLHSIFNLGREYKKKNGRDLPYFAVAVRKEVAARHKDTALRLVHTFKQVGDGINAKPMEAFQLAAPLLKAEPAVLMQAYQDGRLDFTFASMIDPSGRDGVRGAEALVSGGAGKVDDAFFAS